MVAGPGYIMAWRALAGAFALILGASSALADEGFWLFEDFPAARVRAAHGWSPGAAWLERVRLGTPRLTSAGCSSSSVSPRGILMTNRH